MEPWDISKATVARNAGLRNTRRVCVFHDKDQENEALHSAVCSTDVLPCESLLPSPQSQYRPHRNMAVCKLVSRIIFSPDGLFYTQTGDCEGIEKRLGTLKVWGQ